MSEFGSINMRSSIRTEGRQCSQFAAIAGRRSGAPKRVLVLDVDDTLYRNDGKMMKELSKNIAKYVTENLNVDAVSAKNLYKKYGTTLNGLLEEELITLDGVDDFLETIHTFPNEGRDLIKHDEKLRNFLSKVTVEMFIFTASVQSHAKRCCRALGVDDLLIKDSRPIIDTRTCDLNSKYNVESFQICLQEMSNFLRILINPKDLVFVDDSLKNIQCAKKCG